MNNIRRVAEFLFAPVQVVILIFFNFIFSISPKLNYTFVIGVDEIANITRDLSSVFHKDSLSVNFFTNKFYKNNRYDYSIPIESKYLSYVVKLFYGPYLLAKLSNKANVFIYLWHTGFCVDREMDYKFLKYKNKKIISIFLGSDIRSHKLTIDFHNKNMLDTASNYLLQDENQLENERRVVKVARDADKYSDLIFNYTKDQMSYLKSPQLVMPYMYQLDKMHCNKNKFKNIDIIKIVHAPSNPVGKGTPLVRATIKKLTIEGYRIEYLELINTQNKNVLNALQEAHILLNEFYAFIPGVLSIEGMANYCATITSAEYNNFPRGAEHAWLKTRYWEIYDNLKYLLDNPEKIIYYADNGYEYVKNHYTEERVKSFYMDVFYENKIID